MTVIGKEIHFHMGHRVPNHHSKCKMPHGHTYHLAVDIEGDLVNMQGDTEEGMVMDFGFLRDLIEKHVKELLDHRMVLYKKDPLHDILKVEEVEGLLPTGSIVGVDFVPTAENLAQYIFDILEWRVPQATKLRARLSAVTLFETPTSSATVTEKSDV